MQEGGGNPGTRGSNRMPQRNGPAVDVHALQIQLQFPFAREHLRGEGFVEFDEIDLVRGNTRSGLELTQCRNRTQAHISGIYGGRREADKARQRREPAVLTAFSEATMTAAAPSVIPEEFPA